MTRLAVQLQEDATGWADEFGGISQAAEQWADQFAEQIVPNKEVCPCWIPSQSSKSNLKRGLAFLLVFGPFGWTSSTETGPCRVQVSRLCPLQQSAGDLASSCMPSQLTEGLHR